tara:strand:+ start:959 stop:1156 length:198 start_codon:yes stop_codon:yes gene_type:complete
MTSRFDDTKWFTSRPKLGVDYILVVDCGNGGTFKCYSKEDAYAAIEFAKSNGCGYGLSAKDITND